MSFCLFNNENFSALVYFINGHTVYTFFVVDVMLHPTSMSSVFLNSLKQVHRSFNQMLCFSMPSCLASYRFHFELTSNVKLRYIRFECPIIDKVKIHVRYQT